MAFRIGENFDGIPGIDNADVTQVDPVEFLNKQYSAEMRVLESEAEELVRQGKSTQDLEELMKIKAEKYANERNTLTDQSKTEGKKAVLAKLNQEFSGDMRTLDSEAEVLARSGKSTEEFETKMNIRRAEYDKARSVLLVDEMGEPINGNAVMGHNEVNGTANKGISEDANTQPMPVPQGEMPDIPTLTDVVTEEEIQRIISEKQLARSVVVREDVINKIDQNGQQPFSHEHVSPNFKASELPANPVITSSKKEPRVEIQQREHWLKRMFSNFFKTK